MTPEERREAHLEIIENAGTWSTNEEKYDRFLSLIEPAVADAIRFGLVHIGTLGTHPNWEDPAAYVINYPRRTRATMKKCSHKKELSKRKNILGQWRYFLVCDECERWWWRE